MHGYCCDGGNVDGGFMEGLRKAVYSTYTGTVTWLFGTSLSNRSSEEIIGGTASNTSTGARPGTGRGFNKFKGNGDPTRPLHVSWQQEIGLFNPEVALNTLTIIQLFDTKGLANFHGDGELGGSSDNDAQDQHMQDNEESSGDSLSFESQPGCLSEVPHFTGTTIFASFPCLEENDIETGFNSYVVDMSMK
ncbi:hypothetical protein DSL72_006383 [Monilinia vaccinii-corymbosi]|uniref:Uncharacterized protein n=1 Tax=Monilinia vaccinii-corymbosi TaxID=61207 RepID=A0A8A3PNC0_9HELO|nr:hypothetical protein DSL72_006383 [Monilinia vaccinii-corymbosi]